MSIKRFAVLFMIEIAKIANNILKKSYSEEKSLETDKKNVENRPWVDSYKVYLPPLHTKVRLEKLRQNYGQ